MKTLTTAEDKLMQYLWKIKKGFFKDVVDQFPEPKPAYTTIATVLTALVNKGFIGFKQLGNNREYYPLISKKEYTKDFISGIMKKYFSNSYKELVSFFSENEDLSIEEMEEMMKILEKEIKLKKSKKDV